MSLWNYKACIDLENREVTSNEGHFNFGVRAISQFGTSSRKDQSLRVRTSVREAVTSWRDPVTVFAGEEVIFNFQINDPAFEGRVSVRFLERPDQVLGDAVWDCPEVDSSRTDIPNVQRYNMTMCTIRWRIPKNAPPGIYEIPMELTNTSPVSDDKETKTTQFIGKFRVKRAATPPVTPPPAHKNKNGGKP